MHACSADRHTDSQELIQELCQNYRGHFFLGMLSCGSAFSWTKLFKDFYLFVRFPRSDVVVRDLTISQRLATAF